MKTPDPVQLSKWIDSLKVAFISSVDEEGFPNLKAMMPPRCRENGLKTFYFTTNTSSKRVAQYRLNPCASIYFYQKGRFSYQGLMLKGTMLVCEDNAIKALIWQEGDTLYYPQGVNDPDYCVLKFTAQWARYYCNFNHFEFSI